MIKRLMASVVVAGSLTMVGGSMAYAAPPSADPNCTFEKGLTTCTETTSAFVTEITGAQCFVFDPITGLPRFGTIHEHYLETTTTVTTYRGRKTTREPLTSEATSTRQFVGANCIV